MRPKRLTSIAQLKKLQVGDLIDVNFEEPRTYHSQRPHVQLAMNALVLGHCKTKDFISGEPKDGLALLSITSNQKCYLAYEYLAWTWTTKLISRS